MRAIITFKRKLVGTEYVETAVYSLDGKEVTQAEFEKACPPKALDGVPMTDQTSKRVKLSMALGVSSKMIDEAKEHARKRGVPTNFVESGPNAGQAVITSRAHQRALEKTLGYRNYTDYN